MASNGIRDRVAIVGMGCTSFGERWDKSVSDLLVESSQDALNSANVPIDAVDAFWLGTLFSGQSGLTLSRPLKLDYKGIANITTLRRGRLVRGPRHRALTRDITPTLGRGTPQAPLGAVPAAPAGGRRAGLGA
jgi:hypothetical protein